MDKYLIDKFRALSDPTRMAVVEQLLQGPASVSALAEPHTMALPPFTKHLRVLESANLVRSDKLGRIRTYWIHPDGFGEIESWVLDRRRLWRARLNKLDQTLKKGGRR
ncbi:MAG: metalloregulator ArsR/SmtB family transcription factor [Pseudomonadota bacterium]